MRERPNRWKAMSTNASARCEARIITAAHATVHTPVMHNLGALGLLQHAPPRAPPIAVRLPTAPSFLGLFLLCADRQIFLPAQRTPSEGGAHSQSSTLPFAQLLLALFKDPVNGRQFMDTPDSVGARMLHGILVGNQMPALKLGLRVVRAVPETLMIMHAPPIFNDENSLHIMCVNRCSAAPAHRLVRRTCLACISRTARRRTHTHREETHLHTPRGDALTHTARRCTYTHREEAHSHTPRGGALTHTANTSRSLPALFMRIPPTQA